MVYSLPALISQVAGDWIAVIFRTFRDTACVFLQLKAHQAVPSRDKSGRAGWDWPVPSFPKATSPEQCGRDPLQRPSSWHMRVALPTSVRFPRQLYRTTEPTVYLSPEICAWGGEPGWPQETTARERYTGSITAHYACLKADAAGTQ